MYNNILIEDIIDSRPFYLVMTHKMAKKSALIAVDEVLNFRTFLKSMPLEDIYYWKEVQKEIEKI